MDAPANPRLVYRGHAALYKIYVVDRMNSRGPDLAQAEAFLHDALAVIQNALRETPPGAQRKSPPGRAHDGSFGVTDISSSRHSERRKRSHRTPCVESSGRCHFGRDHVRSVVCSGSFAQSAILADTRIHSSARIVRAKEGNYSAAAVHMEQYLAMRPGDVEIRAQLSEILVDHVGTEAALQRAFRLNEDLLRDQIPQSDLRLKQAHLAMLLQKYSDAEAHLRILRTSMPDSSEVWLMTGECQLATRPSQGSPAFIRKIHSMRASGSGSVSSSCRLISETQPHSSQIDDLMHELKTRFRTAESWRIHADWKLSRGQLSEAARDLESALNLAPDDLRSFGRLVQCLQQMPPSQESQQLLDWMRQKLAERRAVASVGQ